MKHNVSTKGNYPNSSNYPVTLALVSLKVCVYKYLLLSRKKKNLDRKDVLFNNLLIEENVTSSKTTKKVFEMTRHI